MSTSIKGKQRSAGSRHRKAMLSLRALLKNAGLHEDAYIACGRTAMIVQITNRGVHHIDLIAAKREIVAFLPLGLQIPPALKELQDNLVTGINSILGNIELGIGELGIVVLRVTSPFDVDALRFRLGMIAMLGDHLQQFLCYLLTHPEMAKATPAVLVEKYCELIGLVGRQYPLQ